MSAPRVQTMFKSTKVWLQNNLVLIQAVTAIIQTGIAAIMVVALFQNAATLRITQRQLESSIEPVLGMAMYGSTLRLTNEGSIDIRKFEGIAIIAGYFDYTTQKISAYQVARGPLPVADIIKPNATVEFNLAQVLMVPVGSDKVADSVSVYCLVLKYRRAADMKQFTKLVPFTVDKDTATQSTDIYMPLFPSVGSSEARSRSGSPDFIYNARQELLRLYRTKVETPDL